VVTPPSELRRRPVVQLTGRIWHIPARLVRHARQRVLKISNDWPVEGSLPRLLAAAVRHARTRLTSIIDPCDTKEASPGAVGAGAHAGTPGSTTRPTAKSKQAPALKPGTSTISNQASGTLND